MFSRRFIFLLLFSLFIIPTLNAQVGWEKTQGLPGGNIIATAKLNSKIYAITKKNMYTSVKGQAWTKVEGQFPDATFLDLTVNDDALWVSMNTQDKVFYSTDGENWQVTNEGLEGIMFAFTLYGYENSVYAYISDGNLYQKKSLETDWELLSQVGSLGAIMRVQMADSLLFAFGNRTSQFGGSNFLVSADTGQTFTAIGKTDSLSFNDSFAFPQANLENFVQLNDSLYSVTSSLGAFSIHLADSMWMKQFIEYTPEGQDPVTIPIGKQIRADDHLYIATREGLLKTNLNYENATFVGGNPPEGSIHYFNRFSDGSFLVEHPDYGFLYLENENAEFTEKPIEGINEATAELFSDKNTLMAWYGSDLYRSTDQGSSWQVVTQPLLDTIDFEFTTQGGWGIFSGNGVFYTRFQLPDPDAQERIRYFATGNSGETWSKITFGSEMPLDLNAGITLTKSGDRYIMTGFETEGGYFANTYLSEDLSFEQSEQVYQVESAFFDDTEFFVIGSLLLRTTINEDRERHLLVSTDAGDTWELKNLNVDTGADFFGITDLVDANGTLVAMYKYGSTPERYMVFASEDEGSSWTHITEGENLFGVYQNLFFIDDEIYLVKGDGIMATLDIHGESIEDLTTEGKELFGGMYANYTVSGDYIMGYNENGFYKMDVRSIVPNEEDPMVSLPNKISLQQNYPNPFNPTTIISFSLNKAESVSLVVFDMLGRKVKTLISNKNLGAGNHQITFDGAQFSSGVYIYRLEAGHSIVTRKMTLIK